MRLITTLLILSVVAGSVEAAGELSGVFANSDFAAHEVHGDFHGGDPGGPAEEDGKASSHFCHCAAHAAAMTISMELSSIASVQMVDTFINRPLRSEVQSPPQRPPRR